MRLAYICAHPTTENPYINFQNLCTDSGPYINSASVGPASFHKPETLNHKSLNPAPFPPKPEVVARHALIGNFTACVNDLKNYAGLTGLGAPVEQDPPPEGTSARGRAARRAPRRPDGRGPLLGRVGDDVDARARRSSGRPSRSRSGPRTRHQLPRGGLRRAAYGASRRQPGGSEPSGTRASRHTAAAATNPNINAQVSPRSHRQPLILSPQVRGWSLSDLEASGEAHPWIPTDGRGAARPEAAPACPRRRRRRHHLSSPSPPFTV